MNHIQNKILITNLFIAAGIGALLRFAFVEEIAWMKFRYFLHAHSHVAMLGWVYLALYVFLIRTFLTERQQQAPFYKWLFWLTQLSVVGMLVTFMARGYYAGSIAFSTLHILFSYAFAWRFLKDLKKTEDRSIAVRFVRTAIWFMILSTVALWGMGPIMATGLQGSALYYAAIQFYLHFQFNGWFIFAVLGLGLKALEGQGVALSPRLMQRFFLLLTISCYPTYALSVTWSTPLPFLFWLNSLGVLIQLAALLYFLLMIKRQWADIKAAFTSWFGFLLGIATLCFALKILMQTAVVIPYIGTVAYTIRNYSIGFLHLMLLGMVTGALFAFGTASGMINTKKSLARIGIALFLTGFIFSELLLFVQGTMFWAGVGFLPFYYEALFGASALLPIGVGGLLLTLFSNINANKKKKEAGAFSSFE